MRAFPPKPKEKIGYYGMVCFDENQRWEFVMALRNKGYHMIGGHSIEDYTRLSFYHETIMVHTVYGSYPGVIDMAGGQFLFQEGCQIVDSVNEIPDFKDL